MKKTTFFGSLLLLASPFIASAQALTPLKNLVASVGSIVFALIPILIGLAVVVFFWGLVKYIRDSGKSHDAGLKTMIAGIVSIFIMVSLYGIIAFAGNALDISQNSGVLAPPTIAH